MRDDDRDALKAEFHAEDKTWIDGLFEEEHDPKRLQRLSRLMVMACQQHRDHETLLRWMAEGFHLLDTQLERLLPEKVLKKENLTHGLQDHFALLASWFFSGECPLDDEDQFATELKDLLAAN